MSEEREILIRYLDVSDVVPQVLLLDQATQDRMKAKALANLGIERREGESFHHAWLRAMSEENGLAFTLPVDQLLANAILYRPDVYRFHFFLA